MTKETYQGNCENIKARRTALDKEQSSLDADYIETAPFQIGDIVECELISPSPDKWLVERIGVRDAVFLYDISPIAEGEIRTHEHISVPVSGESLSRVN